MNNFQLASDYAVTALVSGNYSYEMSASFPYDGTLSLQVNNSTVASYQNEGTNVGSKSGTIYIASGSSVKLYYRNGTTTSGEYSTDYSLTLVKQ